jgi:hypothetical protein
VVIVWLTVCASVAVGARLTFDRMLTIEERRSAVSVAGPLMPALGAAFALLTALTLAGEATRLRSAEDNVSQEGAATARLAWAATNPGIEPQGIQHELLDYLVATRSNEWYAANDNGDPATLTALARLERAVRTAAGDQRVGSAPGGELLSSLDAVTSARRQRLATAALGLPTLYVAVVALSGLALIVNSAALAVSSTWRVALLTAGLVTVVGLSIALLFAISAPFAGGFVVDGGPLDHVVADLRGGLFVR